MSLTRYLPTPSDRMGILWSLLQIEDAIILEYGTEGTTAYAMKIYGMRDFSVQNKLFATGLDENTVVMGDGSLIERKIMELDAKYTPKVIFVMASSVTSVVGSDVKGICDEISEKINAKIIIFTEGGFSGDYSQGFKSCYTKLVENLATEKFEKTDTFNIIGSNAQTPYCKGDIDKIEKCMQEYFGLKLNTSLCFQTSIKEIESMSQAKINIVLSYEGIKSAEILKEKFGTPFVYGYAICEKSLNEWLGEIAKILQLKEPCINIKKSSAKKIAVYGAYDILLSFKKYANENDIEIEFLMSNHNISKIKDKPQEIVYKSTEKEKIEMFSKLSNTVVFANSDFLKHTNSSNKKIDINKEVKTLFGSVNKLF